MHTMRLKMFRVGSPGSGEQKWPQAFHRYNEEYYELHLLHPGCREQITTITLPFTCTVTYLWRKEVYQSTSDKRIRNAFNRSSQIRSTLESKDWLCTDFGYTDITSNGEEGTSHYFCWHISVPHNMTIMVSNAYEEYAAVISGTIIMMYRNILASVWVHVIPGDSACLLIWVRTKCSMIPVELVSASQSGKGNNISVSGKEMEPGSGESTCFRK